MTWIRHGRMGRRSPSKAPVHSKTVGKLLLAGEREDMLINYQPVFELIAFTALQQSSLVRLDLLQLWP